MTLPLLPLLAHESELLDKFIAHWTVTPYVSTVLVVGSLARTRTAYQDIDVLVMVTHALDIPKEKEALTHIAGITPIEGVDVIRFAVSPDSGHELSVALRIDKNFRSLVSRIIAGEPEYLQTSRVYWATGGFMPETLVLDLKTAIIVMDKDGWATNLFLTLTSGYPETLRKGLEQLTRTEISNGIKLLPCLDPRLKNVAIAEMKMSFLRLIFATQRTFFSGTKRLQSPPSDWKEPSELLFEKIMALSDRTPDDELINLFSELNV